MRDMCVSAPSPHRSSLLMALSPERNEQCHEASHLLSHRHLHRPSNNMGLRDLLRMPKVSRRTRSKSRSEMISESVEGASHTGPTVPNPTNSRGVQIPFSRMTYFRPPFFIPHRMFRRRSFRIRFQPKAKQATGIQKFRG